MKICGFSKSYGGRTVLKVDGFELKADTLYGVIGANGSGKSTFGKILSGIVHTDQKTGVIDGPDSICYMPQKSYGFHMSTYDNILLGGKDNERAEHLMQMLQISGLRKQRGDRLSGGETAKMALARSLMKAYDIMILDEPTAAMDIESASMAEQVIRDYQKENGCILFLISHNLRQVRNLSDEILFFHKGILCESGPTQQLLTDPQREETRKFLDYYGQLVI